MKKCLLYLVSLLPLTIFAQDPLVVQEDVRTFSKGNYSSYQVEIPGAKLKDTEKEWMKYLKIGVKYIPIELNGEVVMLGVKNKNVAPDTFNVYSKLLETQNSLKLTAWFTIDDATFFSKSLNSDQDIAAKKYVRDFAVQVYKETVRNEFKLETNKLSKLQSDYKKLVKEDEKANNKISEDQRAIQRNQTAMENNMADQRRKTDEITNQNTVVANSQSVSDDSYKAAKKVLSQMESDLKKLIKEHEKMGKEIDKWNTEIRDMGGIIDQSRKAQQPVSDGLEAQKVVVKNVQDKLNGIK